MAYTGDVRWPRLARGALKHWAIKTYAERAQRRRRSPNLLLFLLLGRRARSHPFRTHALPTWRRVVTLALPVAQCPRANAREVRNGQL